MVRNQIERHEAYYDGQEFEVDEPSLQRFT
jgi:hypothetical protein